LTGGIASTPSNELDEATIVQTLSAESKMAKIRPTPSDISQAPSAKSSLFALSDLARAFPLPWSHYVLLISRTRSPEAFAFYHAEALRGGWSVRQLDRQIASQFYERTAASRNKNAMLRKGAEARAGDSISADEEVRDPLVLEFLGLKDEYSETDLEEALLRHLENFLLEARRGLRLHWSPTPIANRRRMVSRRSSFLSSQTAVPCGH
jgi:predicted nuclease of restriction endonuclease-like (RecB) superfamily